MRNFCQYLHKDTEIRTEIRIEKQNILSRDKITKNKSQTSNNFQIRIFKKSNKEDDAKKVCFFPEV